MTEKPPRFLNNNDFQIAGSNLINYSKLRFWCGSQKLQTEQFRILIFSHTADIQCITTALVISVRINIFLPAMFGDSVIDWSSLYYSCWQSHRLADNSISTQPKNNSYISWQPYPSTHKSGSVLELHWSCDEAPCLTIDCRWAEELAHQCIITCTKQNQKYFKKPWLLYFNSSVELLSLQHIVRTRQSRYSLQVWQMNH